MRRFLPLALLAFFLASAPVRAQSGDEVKQLKDRIELLETKLKLAEKENELLKKEIELLKKGGSKPTGGDSSGGEKASKPTYTDRFNAGTDEVEYVLENTTRSGQQVTFTFSATLKKGGARRAVFLSNMTAVDKDGNPLQSKINETARGTGGQNVQLGLGVKTKVEIRVYIPKDVTHLQTLEINSGIVNRPAIKFSDLDLPK